MQRLSLKELEIERHYVDTYKPRENVLTIALMISGSDKDSASAPRL